MRPYRWLRPIALLSGWILAAGLVAPPGARAQAESQDFDRARADMVMMVQIEVMLSSEVTGLDEIDPRILKAMTDVPRHAFVPEELRPYAYGNHPLPLGHGQNLAAPFLVALMTQLARPEPDDVVLETGTGAGYHAAVLSLLVAEVYSVEVVEPLAEAAAVTLRRLGYDRVQAKTGDGYYGWRSRAPFDAIIVKEAVDHVPVPLLDQLKPGGRLVIPLGSELGPQYLTVVEKAADGSLSRRRVLPVRFSVLQGGKRT
ncbi:MAG: protein-L-isoaspartate(D-aspartate) O-methyltransferase [Kiloniellales bacterium]